MDMLAESLAVALDRTCYCGLPKQAGDAFCRICHSKLTGNHRDAIATAEASDFIHGYVGAVSYLKRRSQQVSISLRLEGGRLRCRRSTRRSS